MVQILPAGTASFSNQLVDVLSGAAGNFAANRASRARSIESGRPKAQTFLSSLLKHHGAQDAYDSEQRLRAQKQADEYISKGYNPTQAGFAAYEDLVKAFPEKGNKTKTQKGVQETKAEQSNKALGR